MKQSDEKWKEQLTDEQYRVLRKKGTETPFSGKFVLSKEPGIYSCAGCGSMLFSSEQKYDSTMPGLIGWPSFEEALNENAVEFLKDDSMGMVRTEVVCAKCKSHLGHLFDDSSSPNGKHYCINSVSLSFAHKGVSEDSETSIENSKE